MSLKFAILGLLDEEPHYGYEIKQKFEQMMGSLWPISYGQLYPTLRKLAEEKLVTMQTVQGKKAVEKNVYSITNSGRERFLRWLGKKDKKDQLSIKDEFTLSLFFLHRLEKQQAVELLRLKAEDVKNRERTYSEEMRSHGPIYKKLLTRKMLLYIQAEQAWLQEVMVEINIDCPEA
ncbi:MAG TPA: PadR family transcriptional regulator [Sediminispirochaeta sp.]|nr:PadR family transcriptional regulator [Sediminispirochaeta sp.]